MNVTELQVKVDVLMPRLNAEKQRVLAIARDRGFNVDNVEVVVEGMSYNNRFSAGTYSTYFNKVTISMHYLVAHPDEVIGNTLSHEIAHAIVRRYFPDAKQAHGKEFRMIHRMLGGTGETYHHMANPEGIVESKRKMTKYVYPCPKCNHEYHVSPQTHKKLMAGGRSASCPDCKVNVKWNGTTKKV